MNIDIPKVRECLKAFDFPTLFREQLGWDNHNSKLEIPIDGTTYRLSGVAQKRGFSAFTCDTIPDRTTRLKIDNQVTKSAREHFVIYTDKAAGQQVWQWVRRELGKPMASRDHRFDISQSGDSLIQRLEQIAIGMQEEEGLTLFDVTGRTRAAFDVDKVTKKFYDRFKKEHADFLKFINGIKDQADLEWYTSLMLNRLMFVYFIQKKGFLDGEIHYLKDRMQKVRDIKGKDKFHNFYRYFLLRLFHDGLGKSPNERKLDKELEKLLGKVPYLNGGFFEVHQLEERNTEIDIPDKAFEKLFAFFDDFKWHLDERPLRDDKEINPDVVGYIFEKYINQKQMGAYYTKEDITEYISKNTIIPFLFDAAEKKCPIAFRPDSFLWRMLREDPDRYIYSAVRHGVIDESGAEIPLPKSIAAGIKNVDKRGDWNKAADEPFSLPTETWREHVARRTRCLELRRKLAAGEVNNINELITLNLDIWQFARDAIVNCEGPELLRAFWQAIQNITVLDPTCGSGAFLFAALQILESLYSDCLERMQRFVEDLDRGISIPDDSDATMFVREKSPPRTTASSVSHVRKFHDVRKILADMAGHASERYFILKSIIINNLFGVDIMQEAVEICKLRLFLKLVAQVERVDQIEPLPDIDFNIRAGNTLVGYVSLEKVRDSQKGTLGFAADDIARIEEDALAVDKAFQQFRAQQTKHGGKVTAEDKLELRKRLGKLDSELNFYLAGEYKINLDKEKDFEKWKSSHQPFHWLVEFHGIMARGGFDVIIGNPPYVEYSKIKGSYTLLAEFTRYATNLYSACSYRAGQIKQPRGYLSFIVPISLPSTDRMQHLRELLTANHTVHFTSFNTRPSKLFEGAEQRLTIFVQSPSEQKIGALRTGGVLKWYAQERPALFSLLEYVMTQPVTDRKNSWPKLRGEIESNIFQRISSLKPLRKSGLIGGGGKLFYKNTGLRYFNTVTLRPPKCWINGELTSSSRETILTVSLKAVPLVHCYLLSTTFFFYYQCMSNCREPNPADISESPFPTLPPTYAHFDKLSANIENDYIKKGRILTMNNKLTGEVKLESVTPARSKDFVDEIDRAFATHFGLSEIELDYVLSYDIKYRVGTDSDDDD